MNRLFSKKLILMLLGAGLVVHGAITYPTINLFEALAGFIILSIGIKMGLEKAGAITKTAAIWIFILLGTLILGGVNIFALALFASPVVFVLIFVVIKFFESLENRTSSQ